MAQTSTASKPATAEQLISALIGVRADANAAYATINAQRELYLDAVIAQDAVPAVKAKAAMDAAKGLALRLNELEADLEARLNQIGAVLPEPDDETLARFFNSCETMRPPTKDQT